MRLLVLTAAVLCTSRAVPPQTKINPPKINPGDALSHIWIPPGAFAMGCSPANAPCFHWELPRHLVKIKRGFWIGETEVTQEAYQRVTGTNPSRYPARKGRVGALRTPKRAACALRFAGCYLEGPKRPVDQVGWTDARRYCERVGMRLPTEAEWEYAANGDANFDRRGLNQAAWYDANSGDQTHEVAQKHPNGFGLCDMLGNVWEWVEDAWGTGGTKLLKGGAFFNLARDVRASNRLWAAPETAHRDMGFRCAAD